jgi:hypothetical protein
MAKAKAATKSPADLAGALIHDNVYTDEGKKTYTWSKIGPDLWRRYGEILEETGKREVFEATDEQLAAMGAYVTA